MIKTECSPTPAGNPSAPIALFNLSLRQKQRSSFCFGLVLLCIIWSVSAASAQTRPKRINAESEQRLRRVEEDRPVEQSSGGPAQSKQSSQPSLVRKTALIYSPRTEKPEASRPTLTNDFVIISTAEESSPASRLMASKASSASSNIPSIWPLMGPLHTGYGMRNDPFGGPSIEFHKGQDIAAPTGTPIRATADGVVVIAGWVRGYGNGIYIDHGNGISTRYGHLSRIDVVVGQIIKRGDHLGLVGSTGRSTGPHLHYEVRINGQAVNPLRYLPSAPAPPAAQ